MDNSLGHKATAGAVWASVDRFGQMALQFIVNLILARLLLPSDFGYIGMLYIFIAVSQTLIDGGFGSALIQKKEPTQVDYSTIFFWNIGLSAVIYLILFFVAEPIATFFGMPILSDILRVIGLSLIINAVLSIQTTRLRKKLAFKTIAVTNLSSYIVSNAAGICLAFHGWGVWSLVFIQLTYGLLSILLLWIITRWHPLICFSRQTMRELFGFGGFILAANLLQEICKNLQGLIIGKKFSATEMGYYSQAYKLDQVSCYSIPQVIVQVMYPVYSSMQDDCNRLISVLRLNIRVISFGIFPIMALLILVAEPLINFLYGAKWMPSVPYFQILCVGGFFVCLQNVNFYAVAARGKSRALFLWSAYKWGFLLLALFVGMTFGMKGILWGMVCNSLNIYLCNAYLVSRYVGLSVFTQIKELLPIVAIMAVAMGVAYFAVCRFDVAPLVAAIIFTTVYLLQAILLRLKAFSEAKFVIGRLVGNKTKNKVLQ